MLAPRVAKITAGEQAVSRLGSFRQNLATCGFDVGGMRNLRRSVPLQTTEVSLPEGRRLRVPTIEETLRIKAFLLASCSLMLLVSGARFS
jgi:hypothetical protein